MKKIQENYSFDPRDAERLIDGNYNISKITDPVEFRRLNNFIATATSYTYDASRKQSLALIRQKFNQIGFDFDVPRTVSESDSFKMTLPLKRFGGVIDFGGGEKNVNDPHGPGPKLDIHFTAVGGILQTKIVPVGQPTAPDAMQEAAPIVAGIARMAGSPTGKKIIGGAVSTAAEKLTAKALDSLSKKKDVNEAKGARAKLFGKEVGGEGERPAIPFHKRLKSDILRLRAQEERDEGEEETLKGMVSAYREEIARLREKKAANASKPTNESVSFFNVLRRLANQ
jgi:hypothetical protein